MDWNYCKILYHLNFITETKKKQFSMENMKLSSIPLISMHGVEEALPLLVGNISSERGPGGCKTPPSMTLGNWIGGRWFGQYPKETAFFSWYLSYVLGCSFICGWSVVLIYIPLPYHLGRLGTLSTTPIHSTLFWSWWNMFDPNIARGTTNPGYWLFNLSYLSS